MQFVPALLERQLNAPTAGRLSLTAGRFLRAVILMRLRLKACAHTSIAKNVNLIP